jgi:hypothetical protein
MMPAAVRLRRSDQSQPGLTRRRSGRGFVYLDADGRRVADEETLTRITGLVIPPAWRDVWISADVRGHLQATGANTGTTTAGASCVTARSSIACSSSGVCCRGCVAASTRT